MKFNDIPPSLYTAPQIYRVINKENVSDYNTHLQLEYDEYDGRLRRM